MQAILKISKNLYAENSASVNRLRFLIEGLNKDFSDTLYCKLFPDDIHNRATTLGKDAQNFSKT